jgi:hypothetical protein
MNALRLTTLVAGMLAFLLPAVPGRAQEDDFDDGNDGGWSRFAPLGPLGGTSIAVSGGKYELSCSPSLSTALYGPARCGSLRLEQSYTNFYAAVDIVNWNPAEDTSMGILGRIQPGAAAGNVNGYAFTYQGQDQDVEINRITGEVPTNLGGSASVSLTPGRSYRLVFFGVGSYLEGLIFDLENPAAPLARTFAYDATYAAGHCGLVVFADANTRAFAVFDNYRVRNGSLPPPATGIVSSTLSVSWDAASALGYALEASDDLQSWQPAPGAVLLGGEMRYQEPVLPDEKPARYFRLRLGPPPLLQ